MLGTRSADDGLCAWPGGLFFPLTPSLTMADRFSELKSFVDDCEKDFQQFYEKGNKAAGTRVRKAMQELKSKAQDIRMEVQDMKKADS
jgi:hypothetical protein